MKHYLFVNFKTYEEGTGHKAVSLSKLLSSLSEEHIEIIPVVQALDIRQVVFESQLKAFAQHCDPIKFGANTGKILPEATKEAGAAGTILNHAENKISNEAIKAAIARCHDLGLEVMVCAETLQRAKEVAEFAPDFIAVEPPELIGGDISVSTARPELISDSVKAIKKINSKIIPITGSGIKTSQDVSKAIELGTMGVFVASGIVCAKDKEYAMRELLSGFPVNPRKEVMP